MVRSVSKGWVSRDERQKRKRTRLKDEQKRRGGVEISEHRGRRKEAVSLGAGMELT